MPQFENKVVIVTGAGSGAGEAIARAFVMEGAKVAFLGRRLHKLEEVSNGLPEHQVMNCVCDVAEREAVNSTVQAIMENFATVDILVNNAGINSNPRSIADTDPDDWDAILQINTTGAFNMSRAVLATMRAKKDGLIINVASVAGVRVAKYSGVAYSASKHAMVAFTHHLNQEEWENGIRATALCPGEIDTPIIDKRPVTVSAEQRAQMLQPEDISHSVLFLSGLPKHVVVPVFIIKPLYQVL